MTDLPQSFFRSFCRQLRQRGLTDSELSAYIQSAAFFAADAEHDEPTLIRAALVAANLED